MHSKMSYRIIVVSVLFAVSLVVSLPTVAQVMASDLPPRPTNRLPPRPSPVPTTPPSDGVLYPEGYIELRVASAQANLWTVVQWQDHLGAWHTVEGWQGTLDEIENGQGKKTWWVGKADMGTGPYRWLIYQSYQGKVLAQSAPFYLPGLVEQTVRVEVSLMP